MFQNLLKFMAVLINLLLFWLISSHNPIANANIHLILGRNYTKLTNGTGIASMDINLVSGSYKVTATYENTTVESSIIVTPTILANDIVKFYRNDTHFVAKFTDSNGTALKDNTTVKFNINGVFYKQILLMVLLHYVFG